MNWYSIFYWMTVADNVKYTLDILSNFSMTLFVLSLIAYIITSIGRAGTISYHSTRDEKEDNNTPDIRAWDYIKKWSARSFRVFMISTVILWSLWAFVPSRKDCLLIVAGGSVGTFLTTDSSVRQLPADITQYLSLSLKKEIVRLKEDAADTTSTRKEKLVDRMKDMTKEEIINYLKDDKSIKIDDDKK